MRLRKLKTELEQAQTIIEFQKKVAQLLGLLPMHSTAAACETGGAA